jgi:hypothetical protein
VNELKPADLLSNAPGERSISLGPDTRIHGDLHAAGTI